MLSLVSAKGALDIYHFQVSLLKVKLNLVKMKLNLVNMQFCLVKVKLNLVKVQMNLVNLGLRGPVTIINVTSYDCR